MSDDDSTMQSWTKNEKNGGKLTDFILQQPKEYLCDSTHWAHVFGTHVYKLTCKPQKELKVNKIHVAILKKIFLLLWKLIGTEPTHHRDERSPAASLQQPWWGSQLVLLCQTSSYKRRIIQPPTRTSTVNSRWHSYQGRSGKHIWWVYIQGTNEKVPPSMGHPTQWISESVNFLLHT